MKIKILLFITLVMVSCKNNESKDSSVAQNSETENIEVAGRQNFQLEVYDFDGLEKFLSLKDDKVYVVNFWATWCKPCVKELPYFEKLNDNYSNQNVEVILVSLDFPHLYESKLKPFIQKNELTSKVVALDDVDMDTWIPKVSESWSGAIPATIIYKNDTRKFYERSFTYNELETEVKQFLN
ncbi:TlpA disulfide reductase family protein [Yeosuana sp. MJ-SS3]|uniref:TlpA disulfide reductase family protein n=1 Tax=Gilvirhabdus luticola TaxID=3079858 RepID=A0ABU3U4K9_9FLAO|nr:TlpA disulfide reductase family protein [Yeosuana sp. MJ-SS3]MDU8885352.1 TlpA disulfide reductase family protein [Yeosuana sp. MJ-SS3]